MGPVGLYRVSLECLDRPVLAQLADVDAHVRAAGGEGVVALPVHVERGGCRERNTHTRPSLLRPSRKNTPQTALLQARPAYPPEWKGNCCLASPVCASQMIVV